MNGSKYYVGDFVQVVSVGATLPEDLIGQIFTVVSKNWDLLVLRPHTKSDYANLHITADSFRMYKSLKARHIEHKLKDDTPKIKFII
ncbi:hypothetical protein M4D47_19470 [Acinetobacter baumannii]|uniref:hypothetical protein n=1 Tax=Acinetobacter baumannii TaxID=470 RepID=UPI00207C1F60|nr:hypothetical protein [Acinetobacter baumannii]MCO1653272.1 hypothetical protein [Acinetobacter baumannii]